MSLKLARNGFKNIEMSLCQYDTVLLCCLRYGSDIGWCYTLNNIL